MRTNLAIVPKQVAPRIDRRKRIKSMVLLLERYYGAKSAMRMLDSIILNFAIYGENRPHTSFRSTQGRRIWFTLRAMAKSQSHKAAVTAAREIQSEYCGFVNAMSA
jgi:hypothetical protein